MYQRNNSRTALLSRDRQLYIELKPGVSDQTREIASGVNVDIDAEGGLIGLDIDGASTKLDLATLETIALPLSSLKAA